MKFQIKGERHLPKATPEALCYYTFVSLLDLTDRNLVRKKVVRNIPSKESKNLTVFILFTVWLIYETQMSALYDCKLQRLFISMENVKRNKVIWSK